MSPEQAKAQEADARSDQFSFGLIVYEMATGKRPFQRASAAETMTAIIREDAEPLASNIPTPVRWVVERCLAKDPAERYDSTRDCIATCEAKEHLSDARYYVAAPRRPRRRRSPLVGLGLWRSFWDLQSPRFGRCRPRILPDSPFATEFEFQAMPRWSPKGDRIAYVAAWMVCCRSSRNL